MVERALTRSRALAAMRRRDVADAEEKLPLIGRSPAMQEIYRVLARLMGTDLTVMITGESGTGKELVARALHDYGKRRSGPFVAINMAAIPRELIESELFGHEKGAFTGATQRDAGRFEQAAGRHAVPRRDRRHAARGADAPAARAAGGRVHHRRRPHSAITRRRAHHRRDPPRPAPARSRQGRSARTCSTASTSCRSACRRCASGARTSPTLVRHFLRSAGAEGLPPKTHRRRRRSSGCKRLSLARQRARAGEPDPPPRGALQRRR